MRDSKQPSHREPPLNKGLPKENVRDEGFFAKTIKNFVFEHLLGENVKKMVKRR